MNRKIPLAVVVAAALAGLGWAWHSQQRDANPGELTLYGNVDIRQVSLAFNASERIAELRAQEGDLVRRGQLLGVLDTRTARLRAAQTDAQIGVQEQALLRLRNGSRPEEIDQARATVAAAEADAELADRQLERLEAASADTAGRGVSRQDLDAARTRRSVAAAQAERARKSARLVTIGPRGEDIAQAEQQLAVVRAERALIQRQLDESELRSPIDAVVRARLLEPGDMASPQRPAFTLAITEPKWVRAWVTEPDLARVRPGVEAAVSIDGLPGQALRARVGYVSSVAEFTPKTVQTPELRTSLVYEVRFVVEDPDDRLRLGMPATVRLRLPPPAQAPTAAK